MTHTTDPLLAIERGLTDAELHQFLARVADGWPGLVGAHVADVLELTTSHDQFLDETEPFYDKHEGAPVLELPAVTPALHTLIILGRELTPANVIKVLTAAGLMPQRAAVPALTWRTYSTPPVRAVTGHQATGADLHYLVVRHPQGSAYQLIRYPRNGTFTETVIEAASYAAAMTTPDEGRRLAELFEAGQDIPEIGWYHGTPPTGMSTT